MYWRDGNEGGDNLRPFVLITVGVLLILAARLWHLQVIKGREYRLLSERNRIRLVKIPPPRGRILDRRGRVLADNRPSFSVQVVPEDVPDKEELAKRLGAFLDLPEEEVLKRLKAKRRGPFHPVKIEGDISWREVSLIKAHQMELPGVMLTCEPVRSYPYGRVASHLLGHVGKVSNLRLAKARNYDLGDIVGKTGVEAAWEDYLRGVKGGKQVEVDALGREIRVLREVEPVPGWDLYLSIDLDLQRLAERLLLGKVGAIVAIDPRTGRVLALCSSPDYDPTLFADGISPEMWRLLLEDPRHPLTNRAIQGLYAPGSVFKIIVAAAALERGVIDPRSSLYCFGELPIGNKVFRCWKEKGHKRLQLHRAIVESCDIFFYQLGLMVGPRIMHHYAVAFGLGRPTKIALPGEKAGIVPSPSWKRMRKKEAWFDGETALMAIGQGYLLVTPLQMARMIAAIANGGDLYLPRVALRVVSPSGRGNKFYQPKREGRLPISSSTLTFLRKALLGVVEEAGGTGKAAYIKGVKVAGKTGTAQVSKMGEERLKPEEMPYEKRDHAWFVAFAPEEAPSIAVTVVVEHGGHGGSAAAPLAREVIRRWLEIEGETGG